MLLLKPLGNSIEIFQLKQLPCHLKIPSPAKNSQVIGTYSVAVEWSACMSSTPTTRVQILLKSEMISVK